MNTIEPIVDRQASLKEYLNDQLEDILTIKPGSLLFKSKKRKGNLILILGILMVLGSIWPIYAGLTHQEYIYGYGLYIREPSAKDWVQLILGIILLVDGCISLLIWMNARRMRLRIYVNEIKGIAMEKNQLIAMPVQLNIREINSVHRKFSFITIKTDDKSYFFHVARSKKAFNLLKLQLETLKSLPL